MRRLASIAVFLAVFAFVPLAAQDDGPNVFVAYYYKTLPGKASAYQDYLDVRALHFDELVRRGMLVSYQFLAQGAGTGEFTNINLYEYAHWDAVNDVTPQVANDACQAVFGMTCQQKDAEFFQEYGELPTLRKFIRTEVYRSVRP